MKNKVNQLIKAIIQIACFLCFAESFAYSLYAVKSLVNVLAEPSAGAITFTGTFAQPLLILAGTIPCSIVFGRYYCGYICSFGAMQDLFDYLRRLIMPKATFKLLHPAKKASKILAKVKYLVLVVLIAGLWLGVDVDAKLGPWPVFGRYLTPRALAGLFHTNPPAYEMSVGLLILVLVALLSVFIPRFFCRFLCPMGAIYSLMGQISVEQHRSKKTVCQSGGECSVCRHRCSNYQVNYIGLGVTLLVFALVNVWAIPTLQKALLEDTSLANMELDADTSSDYVGLSEVKTGSAEGFRGELTVEVKVEDGRISQIDVVEHMDDDPYMDVVKTKLIPRIISEQSTEVDAVSGATYSSKGVIRAVEQALEGIELDGADVVEGTHIAADNLTNLADGVYEGSAIGFYGELVVAVTVTNHEIERIRVVSYYDTDAYIFHAAPMVFEQIISEKSLDVDAVSGATFSGNALVKAVADALGVDENELRFEKPKDHSGKGKKKHFAQKFVESDEEYEELVAKYANVSFDERGIRKSEGQGSKD